MLCPGVHQLSQELTIDRPLRLIGLEGAESTVVCSSKHVVVRSRCAVSLSGVTLCRLGDEVGYPNAVAFAEVARLSIDGCRITCGGGASDVAQALHAFDGAPAAGEPWEETPDVARRGGDAAVGLRRQDRPQSGLWVGAAAHARLRRSIISCTQGPGVKIYRGELEVMDSTIAFSCRGANIVANGGKVHLRHSEIRSALGDGISSWNNALLYLEHNRIHSNAGSGVAVNSVGGEVSIGHSHFFDNAKAAVLFVTSHVQRATLDSNTFAGNRGGDVLGLNRLGSRTMRPPQLQCPLDHGDEAGAASAISASEAGVSGQGCKSLHHIGADDSAIAPHTVGVDSVIALQSLHTVGVDEQLAASS